MMRAQRESALRRVAVAAGFVAIGIGGGHVLAWMTGLMPRVPGSTIIMKTNAGLGLLVAGLALVWLAMSGPTVRRRRLAQAAAVFVLALGLATLAEHALGWNLHIDQILATEPIGAPATTRPNRMGPPAAASFALLGIALVLLSRRRRRRPLHEAFAAIVALLGLLSVIGYLYEASELYAVARLTAIAWPTAVSLFVLAVGLLCAEPGEGLTSHLTADDPGGAIVRALIGPIVAVPIVFGWVRLAGERFGWFDAPMGTGVMMLLFIVTFSSLLLFASRRVSLAAAARKRADDALAARAAEQHALLEALGKSDQQFRALIENVNAGVALIDGTGRFALYNRQFLTMFGLAADVDIHNINDQDWGAWHVFDETGRPLNIDEHPVREAALTGRAVRDRLVKVVRPGGGTPVWMGVSAEPLRGADGRIDRIICTYNDVTDRKKAEESLADKAAELERDIGERKRVEEALRRSEEKFAKAFRGNTAAMAITRMDDGRYIEVNDRFAHVTGFTRAQVIGRRADELEIWKDRRDRQAFVRDLQRHGIVRNAEYRFVRPGGEEWIGLVSSQVSEIEGEAALISSFSDVTEPRRMEEALRDANEKLREADRRKDEFLAMLSHELRNPLAPVRAALYVLEHAVPGGEQAKRAKTVVDRQVAQLSRLVDDLLDVTRVTRGKIHLHREPIELNGLARRTAEDHRELFTTRGVELDVEVSAGDVWVEGDAQRLAQVVGNLLHNAAKFTDPGGRTIIRVSSEEKSRTAVVSVRDTGIGMDASALHRLFEPFMQVDETMDRARGGLGLGLSLVKSLTEMHGGTVSVESNGIGQGAEFTIRLPRRPAPAPAGRPAVPKEQRSRRIFIVEDNVDAAESLCEALKLAGHEVEVAFDGPEALRRIRAFRPEIVLCDIGLPGMSGYEVARALRSDDATASTYLIALTGYALPEDAVRAREAGFDLHVAKPPDPDKLQRALALASARRR